MRLELEELTLEQLRERATRDAGEDHCAEAEQKAAAAAVGDEAATRSALTELVLKCVPSFLFRATAVLIRGGPIEVRLMCLEHVWPNVSPHY